MLGAGYIGAYTERGTSSRAKVYPANDETDSTSDVPKDQNGSIRAPFSTLQRTYAHSKPRSHSDRPYHQPEDDSKKGSDSDTNSRSPSTPYHWQDLLNQELPPTDFDAALKSVLQSEAEMEKIKGLNKQEIQPLIDVFGRVSTLFCSLSMFCYPPTPCPPVLGDRGRDERTPEEMLQITMQDLRLPWNFTNTVYVETKQPKSVKPPGLHWRIWRSVERRSQ